MWRVRQRRSSSPPPPPIAAPLLEMGFTIKHILKAICETRSTGEVNARTVNMLATWMCEHPYLETRVDSPSAVNPSNVREILTTSSDFLERCNRIIDSNLSL